MKGSDGSEDHARGFAGLGDLLEGGNESAGVGYSPASENRPSSIDAVKSSATAGSESENAATARPEHESETRAQSVYQDPEPQPQRDVPWGWVAAAVALIVIGIASQNGGSSSQATSASQMEAPITVDKTTVVASTPDRQWVESVPPVGENQVLSRDQIRYCLSQDVRLEATRAKVDTSNDNQVDLFNQYVEDFNKRCGHFRYREGDIEPVRREVEAERGRLTLEGSDRIAGVAHEAPTPPPDAELTQKYAATTATLGASQEEVVNYPETARNIEPNAEGGIEWADVTQDERVSIESVCGLDRKNYGADAYDICFTQQMAALASAPRGNDLSQLSPQQRQSVETACNSAKYMEGPAAFDQCIDQQIKQVGSEENERALASLDVGERLSVRQACAGVVMAQDPAEYSRCVKEQLAVMREPAP